MEEKLLKIINHYGVLHQLKYFQSEVFELNEAIIKTDDRIKFLGNSHSVIKEYKDHITEEIADVMVMLEQLKLYYDISSEEITDIFWSKVDRTVSRIEEGYYDK